MTGGAGKEPNHPLHPTGAAYADSRVLGPAPPRRVSGVFGEERSSDVAVKT